MSTVTGRLKEVKQPRGGYINPKDFEVVMINDGKVLNDNENIHASIVGLAVDYLTRFMMGTEREKAFEISYKGANVAYKYGRKKAIEEANTYLGSIDNLEDISIISACKMVTFDAWYRNVSGAVKAQTADDINPDKDTVENIRIMVERGINFWKKYGPIISDGFSFEPNGYTKTVTAGDGDYLTRDTLWDFKVIKNKPTNKHTLQLLMYWIMGLHSGQRIFTDINKLGIFNPRLGEIYTLCTKNIPQEIVSAVEKEVICY